MNLTPQQKEILDLHRSMDWVCSTKYEFIRDHRKRISELNDGYLKEKGYRLVGEKCDGRCGTKHTAPVFMRRAEKIEPPEIKVKPKYEVRVINGEPKAVLVNV